MPFHAPLRDSRRGLTLVELLIATTIAGVVTVGIFSVFLQALKIYDYDSKKLTVNRYIRDFTAELTENATFANYALIFPDFSTRANVSPVLNPDTGNIETAGINVPVEDGQSGDMLVLVFVDPANDKKIKRIVGYYRAAPTRGAAGPVRRFEREFEPSSDSTAVALLPANSTIEDWPQVIELSEGLSDGRLFHNFYGRSVMVNGEIIQDSGGRTRVASNTYNFTISPRG
jgi:prepilin-type N-terminal cleavage/methylation domain-containing protein